MNNYGLVFDIVIEEYHLFQVDLVPLGSVAELMEPFSSIFDSLEFTNVPTLQNVVPSYYMMKNYVQPNKNELFIVAELKIELLNS